MTATFLMLPPQTPITREWAKRLAAAQPNLSVIVAENETEAADSYRPRGRGVRHGALLLCCEQLQSFAGFRRRRRPRLPAGTTRS